MRPKMPEAANASITKMSATGPRAIIHIAFMMLFLSFIALFISMSKGCVYSNVQSYKFIRKGGVIFRRNAFVCVGQKGRSMPAEK